ncbi:MAG: hypothetical protein J6W03_09690 [Bacteroidaceae bacterium]|nr:hypothetical protein [Bacteroidaceae bacterium]
MKRILFLLFAMLICAGVQAKKNNNTRLFKGALSALQDSEARGFVVIDYSKTKVEGKPLKQFLDLEGMTMDDFTRNDSERIRYFREKWNGKMKQGMRLVTQESEATHYVRIRINKFNYGMSMTGRRSGSTYSLSGVQGGGASFTGYVDIVPKGSDTPVCTLEVLEMNGTVMGSTFNGERGILRAFNDQAENICKLVKQGN